MSREILFRGKTDSEKADKSTGAYTVCDVLCMP